MTVYRTKLGHAHLKVRDLDRAVAFYQKYFGLRLTERVGEEYAFLSGGPLHHELALRAMGPEAPPARPDATGLYHVAFEAADKGSFAAAFRRLTDDAIPVILVDHAISWAMYFSDPSGNGLEIYVDTRRDVQGRDLWRGEDRPLDPSALAPWLR